MRVGGKGKKYTARLKSFHYSLSLSRPQHKFLGMFERREKSLSDFGGQEVFRRCWGWMKSGGILRRVVSSAHRPQSFSLLSAAPSSSGFSLRAQRPAVGPLAGESGCTEPGPDSSTLPSTCPAPRESRLGPEAQQPGQPPGRAPLLPYLARLCCTGRRGRGPAGQAGRARVRAPSPWQELLAAQPPGPVSRPGEGGSRPDPSAQEGEGRGGGAPPGPGRGLQSQGADRGALGARLPMLPAPPDRTSGRARRRVRRGEGRPGRLTEGNPRPLQAGLCQRRRRGCSV